MELKLQLLYDACIVVYLLWREHMTRRADSRDRAETGDLLLAAHEVLRDHEKATGQACVVVMEPTRRRGVYTVWCEVYDTVDGKRAGRFYRVGREYPDAGRRSWGAFLYALAMHTVAEAHRELELIASGQRLA